MKDNIIVIVLLFSFFFFKVDDIYAHPGNTASDGCHYCRTNCAKWGYTTGTRHCHGGGTTVTKSVATVKPIYAPSTSTPLPTVKPTYIPSTTIPTYKPIETSKSSDNGDSSLITLLVLGGAGAYGYQKLKGSKKDDD
jgi:hypothetical protein